MISQFFIATEEGFFLRQPSIFIGWMMYNFVWVSLSFHVPCFCSWKLRFTLVFVYEVFTAISAFSLAALFASFSYSSRVSGSVRISDCLCFWSVEAFYLALSTCPLPIFVSDCTFFPGRVIIFGVRHAFVACVFVPLGSLSSAQLGAASSSVCVCQRFLLCRVRSTISFCLVYSLLMRGLI